MLLLLLIAIIVFIGLTQSSPAEEAAEIAASGTSSDVVDNEDANNCYKAVDEKNWQAAWYSCPNAAESGDAGSATNMGYLYSNGLGVKANQMEAVGWFRKAADQGDLAAQFNLANAYEYGTGVTQNIDEALTWYKKAAAQGDEDARKRILSLEKERKIASQPNAIPDAFHGEWNEDGNACGTASNDSKLVISESRLSFWESDAFVKSLQINNPRSVTVTANYTGEGQNWSGTITLNLSRSEQELTIDGFTRYKCP